MNQNTLLEENPATDRLRFLQLEEPTVNQPSETEIQAKGPEEPRRRQFRSKTDDGSPKLISNVAFDSNALLPLNFPIYREFWRTGMNNNWIPTDVPMTDDIATWRKTKGTPGALTEEERRMVMINFQFFSPAESLIGNNVILALYNYITDPAARQALGRIFTEEGIHNETFMYIVESLRLNEKEVYSAYKNEPVIMEMCAFMQDATAQLVEQKIDTNTLEGKRTFMDALLAQMIMEGILFYSGFVMILSLKRRNLLPGVGTQYAYIMRDESLHIEIIRTIFNHLKDKEWPEVWDDAFKTRVVEKIKEAIALSVNYANFCLPNGIMGLKANTFNQYVQYLGDRRLEFMGMPKLFNASNPFPWLSEMIDLPKEVNFFEGTVTDYQARNLSWT